LSSPTQSGSVNKSQSVKLTQSEINIGPAVNKRKPTSQGAMAM
jgi:hypothetical protein